MPVTRKRGVPPSVRVVNAVAEREGVDPIDLDVPLYAVIDPDALDAIVPSPGDRDPGSSVRVEFAYHGYRVVVDADGAVDVSLR